MQIGPGEIMNSAKNVKHQNNIMLLKRGFLKTLNSGM